MRLFLFIGLFFLTSKASSSFIAFDPNDFPEGAHLNNAVDGVKVSTLHGGDVFSSPLIGDPQQIPPGFVHAGPVGNQVLSTSPTVNSEWMATELAFFEEEIRTIDALRTYHSGFLLFNFKEPTDFISLLSLELFEDAGWGGVGGVIHNDSSFMTPLET